MIKVIFVIQAIAYLGMVVGVLGHKLGVLPFKVAFGGFALALVLLLLSLIVALLLVLFKSDARALGAMAAVLGLAPLLAIGILVGPGLKAPRIHNIATDLDNPVDFGHAQQLRKPGENSLAHPEGKVRELHQQFYSDIGPLKTSLDAPQAYERALELAREFGWTIAYQDQENLHFEAVVETRLFGFKDDIAVEIRMDPDTGASRIEMRSVSRVGVSDMGANAARIRAFQREFGQ